MQMVDYWAICLAVMMVFAEVDVLAASLAGWTENLKAVWNIVKMASSSVEKMVATMVEILELLLVAELVLRMVASMTDYWAFC